jgi:hypothetical protein
MLMLAQAASWRRISGTDRRENNAEGSAGNADAGGQPSWLNVAGSGNSWRRQRKASGTGCSGSRVSPERAQVPRPRRHPPQHNGGIAARVATDLSGTWLQRPAIS